MVSRFVERLTHGSTHGEVSYNGHLFEELTYVVDRFLDWHVHAATVGNRRRGRLLIARMFCGVFLAAVDGIGPRAGCRSRLLSAARRILIELKTSRWTLPRSPPGRAPRTGSERKRRIES